MTVHLYDGRTGDWRTRDVPFPLQPELTLSVWTTRRREPLQGTWTHTVWRRTGPATYDFLGTAPDDRSRAGVQYGLPHASTVRYPVWQLRPRVLGLIERSF